MINLEYMELFFNKIYEEFQVMVFAYLFSRVNQKEIAKDLVQEVFTRAWKNISLLSELGLNNSRYWLFRTAKNIVTDYYRSRSFQQKLVKEMESNVSVLAKSPEDQLEMDEELEALSVAITKLPEKLRIPLTLQVMANMNSKQISEMLEVPAGTIRYRISLARKQLLRVISLNGETKGESN